MNNSNHFRYILSVLCVSFSLNAAAFTVVIDAGHGGHDPGALGAITREKDLNLEVSKRLGKLIGTNCDGVEVLLTRTTDVFLTLQERADFVNKHNADLFICVHTNSAENKAVCGAETFTLGLDKMASNLDVAMRENAVMMLEDDYQTKYQGFDPNSVESYIMFEFLQDQYIDKSLQFASLVQQQFSSGLHRADRGVRQAAFWVLHKSACPSVLVEMGFISNREEEKYLASDKGKDEIAKAIYNAFCAYKQTLDRKAAAVTNPTVQVEVEDNTVTAADAQAVTSPVTANNPPKTSAKYTTTAQGTKKTTSDIPTQHNAKPIFRVQVFSVKAPLKEGDASFRGLKGCKYTKDGIYYKYTYGEETDYQKILTVRKQLLGKFADCFVVAFLDGKQILVKDALKMAENAAK